MTNEAPPASSFKNQWGWYMRFTETMRRDAVVSVPELIVKEGLAEFDRMKTERGWPADAKPSWELRWTYFEPADPEPEKDAS
jgi:hypothetical protein